MNLLFFFSKYAFFISVLVGAVLVLWFVVESHFEKEKRAAQRATLLLFCILILIVSLYYFPFNSKDWFYLIWTCAVLIGGAVFLVTNRSRNTITQEPVGRIDERDIMFSRKRLIKGTERYDNYYKQYPEKLSADNLFRSKPGLLDKQSQYFDKFQFNAAEASFSTVETLKSKVEGLPAKEKVPVNADNISGFLKGWMKKLNAVSVGITEMKDYHWYSNVGRGDDYGKEVKPEHKFGIAFTVEMDREQMSNAPYGPTIMESAAQYLNAGAIAVQVSEFIRSLGYSARAHIDGNYRVVCPLVAKDAGLGELGRMGLLMTSELGSRVRIAVVTTDIPLVTDKVKDATSVIEFCRICRKCADVCPSRSISFNDREDIDGIARWQINSESCFTYWCSTGTDCGRCMYVCPYSHPNTPLHNFVRKGISRNRYFRKLALVADDFFYGRKPGIAPVHEWQKTL